MKQHYFANPVTPIVKFDLDMTISNDVQASYEVRVHKSGADIYTPANKLAASLTRSEVEEILRTMNALEAYSIAGKLDRAREREKAA